VLIRLWLAGEGKTDSCIKPAVGSLAAFGMAGWESDLGSQKIDRLRRIAWLINAVAGVRQHILPLRRQEHHRLWQRVAATRC